MKKKIDLNKVFENLKEDANKVVLVYDVDTAHTPDLKKILETILNGQFEIIKILRKSVVSVQHIKQVFAQYGIKEDEPKF